MNKDNSILEQKQQPSQLRDILTSELENFGQSPINITPLHDIQESDPAGAPQFLLNRSDMIVHKISSGFLTVYEKCDKNILRKIERRKAAGEDIKNVLAIYLARSRSEILVQLVYGKQGIRELQAVCCFV